jgi:multidrug resistance efflux pump
MTTRPLAQETAVNQALAELLRLRRFTGPPAEFWSGFLAAASSLVGACRGVLILRDSKQPEQWKKLGDWTDNGHADRSTLTFTRQLTEIADRCAQGKNLIVPLDVAAAPSTKNFALAIRLQLFNSEQVCIAVFLVLDATELQAQEALLRLQLIADTPASYQQNQLAFQAQTDVEKFASTLDLMVLVNAEKRFLSAALALCNGLATRYGCDRVSLGWVDHGYIKLQTISRTERFDRKMAAAKALEVAMEESLDQDEEIVWPAPEGTSLITRDHEKFSRDQTSGNICSLPLRLDSKPLAVLTCERQGKVFTPVDVQQLRLTCDQAIRRLSDLKQRDRWFGARWASQAREKLAPVLGPEHTWAKLLALAITASLIVLMLPIWKYRVEGNFILRSDDVSYLTAPFEGYISKVSVRPGDPVKRGDVLLNLNTVDLELEESSANADLNRYLREAEKAGGAKPPQLADMVIAKALAEQARARLDLVRHRLEQSALKAPFDGVMVEGDLRQRVGAPVKQGEALFKVARLDPMYVEAEINERDVHRISDKSKGEISFVSQPKSKFPIRIDRVEPAATAKKEGNVFIVRAALEKRPESWWRPGMSGLAKIDVDTRSLFWILTHRTVDFLRLWLWW